jgi:hypothetical protein
MNDVRIRITIEEWRMITDWLHQSLAGAEHSPYGHFLLECDGDRRTWVATDTRQMSVVRTTGPAARGIEGPFEVRINPRLFRNRPAQDATLVVSCDGERRMVSLDTDEVCSSLPEHDGDREPWRTVADEVGGVTGRVGAERLREAVAMAMVVPFGVEPIDSVACWIEFERDALVLRTGWPGLPSTTVRIPADTGGESADPVLVDVVRLHSLVDHIDFDRVEMIVPTDRHGAVAVRVDGYTGVLAPLDPLGDLRERLGELLSQFLGSDDLEPDEDGDFVLATPEGSRMVVCLMGGDPTTVRFAAVLAELVRPSPELFEELNAINASVRHLKVVHRDDTVQIEVDLDGDAIDDAAVTQALRTIRSTAREYRHLLGPYFASEVP